MSLKFITGLQSKYDALTSKDEDAIYYISDTQRIYKGDTLYSSILDIPDWKRIGQDDIPQKYSLLSGLIFDGRQAFDTGIKPDGTTRWVLKGDNLTVTSAYTILFGSTTTSSLRDGKNTHYALYATSGDDWYLDHLTFQYGGQEGYSRVVNRADCLFNKGNQFKDGPGGVVLSGVESSGSQGGSRDLSPIDFQVDATMYIGGLHDTSQEDPVTPIQMSSYTLNKLTFLTSEGKLLADYRPVKITKTGQSGLYDLVSHKFLRSITGVDCPVIE